MFALNLNECYMHDHRFSFYTLLSFRVLQIVFIRVYALKGM